MKRFANYSGARIILEQSPEESLKLPLIKAALPNARFIHLVRDGYDCIASIMREWEKRQQLVAKNNPLEFVGKVAGTLSRQPYWHFRLLQLRFELSESGMFKPWRWKNKSKWQGKSGWGVRIPGWQDILADEGQLTLNARQWTEAVSSVRQELAETPSAQWKEIRYEDLVTNPEKELAGLVEWMNVKPAPVRADRISANSIGRGRKKLTDLEVSHINPIIKPLMDELGYPLLEVKKYD